MSSFSGKLSEIPQISVDNFDYENLNSEVYFLSHCHTDHMRGLAFNFRTIFLENKKYLYASEVSCLILRKQYPDLACRLRTLDMYSATAIKLNDEIISVTPISAGHCPGSIMFLFETRHTTILYTGDYRINPNDLKKFKAFYDSSNRIKIIDKLYLDTTFFLPQYKILPPRNQVVDELCATMTQWMEQDENNMINLDTPSPFGYESLILEIYKRLKFPIHLSERTYNIYKYFPDLDKATTTDGNVTRIHSYCAKHHYRICKPFANVKRIRVSAMYWKEKSDFSLQTEKGTTYACYSTHASLEEGLELIRFLKPKAIHACVEQKAELNVEMNSQIQNILQEIHGSEETMGSDDTKKCSVVTESPFNAEFVRKVDNLLVASASRISGYDFFTPSSKRCNEDDSLLDSPPRKAPR